MKRYVWALCAALLTAACTDDAELQPSVPENVDEETFSQKITAASRAALSSAPHRNALK